MSDSTEYSIDTYTPPVNNQFKSFSAMIFLSLGLGLHNITVQARGTSTDTVTVRRKRIVIMKR